MNIDVPVLISILSLIVAATMCIINLSNLKRNRSHDSRQEAIELTTLLVKLENISNGINEIKSKMREMENDNKELRDRLIIVEQSAKSAHRRLDTMKLMNEEGKE